jgi:hypothetical protein
MLAQLPVVLMGVVVVVVVAIEQGVEKGIHFDDVRNE